MNLQTLRLRLTFYCQVVPPDSKNLPTLAWSVKAERCTVWVEFWMSMVKSMMHNYRTEDSTVLYEKLMVSSQGSVFTNTTKDHMSLINVVLTVKESYNNPKTPHI